MIFWLNGAREWYLRELYICIYESSNNGRLSNTGLTQNYNLELMVVTNVWHCPNFISQRATRRFSSRTLAEFEQDLYDFGSAWSFLGDVIETLANKVMEWVVWAHFL